MSIFETPQGVNKGIHERHSKNQDFFDALDIQLETIVPAVQRQIGSYDFVRTHLGSASDRAQVISGMVDKMNLQIEKHFSRNIKKLIRGCMVHVAAEEQGDPKYIDGVLYLLLAEHSFKQQIVKNGRAPATNLFVRPLYERTLKDKNLRSVYDRDFQNLTVRLLDQANSLHKRGLEDDQIQVELDQQIELIISVLREDVERSFFTSAR